MVDPGENVSVTVRREFEEEAGNLQDPAEKAECARQLDQVRPRVGCPTQVSRVLTHSLQREAALRFDLYGAAPSVW